VAKVHRAIETTNVPTSVVVAPANHDLVAPYSGSSHNRIRLYLNYASRPQLKQSCSSEREIRQPGVRALS
jgi:hypothetical protein